MELKHKEGNDPPRRYRARPLVLDPRGGGTTITRITLSSIRSLKQWNNVAPQVEGQYDTLLKEFI